MLLVLPPGIATLQLELSVLMHVPSFCFSLSLTTNQQKIITCQYSVGKVVNAGFYTAAIVQVARLWCFVDILAFHHLIKATFLMITVWTGPFQYKSTLKWGHIIYSTIFSSLENEPVFLYSHKMWPCYVNICFGSFCCKVSASSYTNSKPLYHCLRVECLFPRQFTPG